MTRTQQLPRSVKTIHLRNPRVVGLVNAAWAANPALGRTAGEVAESLIYAGLLETTEAAAAAPEIPRRRGER